MKIDAHVHIGYWPSLNKVKRTLIASLKKYEFDYAIFSSDASEVLSQDHPDWPDVNCYSSLEIAKDALSFAKKHKNLFMLYWIKPNGEKLTQEMKEFILSNRNIIKGLKIHPCLSEMKITDHKLEPYLQFAKENDLPILVHTAKDKYSDIKYLSKVCKKYPTVNFIAAHMQLLSNNKSAVKELKANPNLYGDTAWVKPENIKYAINEGLENKIMFGSDNPIDGLNTYMNQYYQSYFANSIQLNRKQYNKLMYKNAIKVYNLPL